MWHVSFLYFFFPPIDSRHQYLVLVSQVCAGARVCMYRCEYERAIAYGFVLSSFFFFFFFLRREFTCLNRTYERFEGFDFGIRSEINAWSEWQVRNFLALLTRFHYYICWAIILKFIDMNICIYVLVRAPFVRYYLRIEWLHVWVCDTFKNKF